MLATDTSTGGALVAHLCALVTDPASQASRGPESERTPPMKMRFGPATCTRAFITTALMLLATLAAAQQCTYEIEPNETPAEATLIRPPDSSGTFNADGARMPIICLAGEISGSNQD